MEVQSRLPDPSPAELASSNGLRQLISAELLEGDGFMSFDRYMARALFEPGLGYYMNDSLKFGAAGDFVTAPEVSPLFGHCLARHWLEVRTHGDTILEFGGGSGRLAADVLTALDALDALPARYSIVELSPQLRARQQALLASLPFAHRVDITWLAGAPAAPIRGLVIANEILDALPTTLFQCAAQGFLERGIGLDDAGRLAWRERPASEALQVALRVRTAGLGLPPGYRSEINLAQDLWLADLPRFIQRGVVLVFDYGSPRRELYHADRTEGTLRCYWRHRLHDDPLWLPGLQDLTASVDFTGVAEAGVDAGFEVLGFSTQAGFLLANGIESALQDAMLAEPDHSHRLATQARMLLLPSEMGTRFKAIALGLGAGLPHGRFAMRDERHLL